MPEHIPPTAPGEPISIIGIACRFPDARDVTEFLELCVTGRRAFRRLPPVRLDPAGDGESGRGGTEPDRGGLPRAALIEGWRFDRAAFGITQTAYRAADPAHWLALETASRALADAGFPGGQGLSRDRTGVVIGNTLTGDVSRATRMRSRWPYVRRALTVALTAGDVPPQDHASVIEHAADAFLGPFPGVSEESLAGSLPGAIADRICGHFGFRGGGHAIDAADSSSLLAVATACAALAAGDLDTALAGGVDISLDPFELTALARMGVLAGPEMRIFDARPAGFWPGEGGGLVVLMRAADARAAGVPAYADIAGWGVSSAGNPALTGPGSGSLLLALRRAHQRAGIDPADIQLIEGDGTGTASGDLAELTSLAEMRAGAPRLAALGSVKANIGHTRAAAGAAGLVKATLAAAAGVIPPATGCLRPHPLIASQDARVRVPRTAEPWPQGPRLAGISAVGPGGTSVHLIVRRDTHGGPRRRPPGAAGLPAAGAGPRRGGGSSEPWAQVTAAAPGTEPFALSGPDHQVLASELRRIADVAPWLSDGEWHDLACQAGRRDGARVRVSLVAGTQDELADRAREAATLLAGLAPGVLATAPGIFAADGGRGRVALLFPGEGASLAPPPARPSPGETGSYDPALQPAIASASLAGLRWLDRLGVVAAAAIGHGLGEITGLVWAGCLPEPDAALLVSQRASLLGAALTGRATLVRVDADEQTARQLCSGTELEIAAYNGPRCHVLAGPTDTVHGLTHRLAEDGVPAHVLGSPYGFSSPVMADRVTPMRGMLAHFSFQPPRRRLLSTVTGAELTPGDDIGELLCAQLTSPVRFAGPLRQAAAGADLLVETGPGRELALLAADCCEVPAVSLVAAEPDEETAAEVAAALFASGAVSSLAPAFAGRAARPVDIWRERVFIANPCGAPPPPGLVAAPAAIPGRRPAVPTRAAAPAGQAASHAAGPGAARGAADREPAQPTPAGPAPAPATRGPGPASVMESTPPGPAGHGTAGSPGAGLAARDPGDAGPPRPGPATPGPAVPGATAAGGAPSEPADPGPAGSWTGGQGPAGPVTGAPERAPGQTAPRLAHASPQASRPAGTATPAPDEPGGHPAVPAVAAATRPLDLPAGQAGPRGAGPWVRVFTEQPQPAPPPDPPAAGRSWRLFTAADQPLGRVAAGIFEHGPRADCVLAVVGDPAGPGECAALLDACRESVHAGCLVVVTTVPGVTGFCASLHAERPSLGITVIQTVAGADGLLAARRFATAVPGRLREFVLDESGTARQPVMTVTEPAATGPFPLGPADVVLVSGIAGAGELACAATLAGRGAALAVLAPPGPDDPRLAALLADVRAAGARVSRKKADPTDPGQVAAAVRSLERSLGPVTAVVHAAAAGPIDRCDRLPEAAVRKHLTGQYARLATLLGAVAMERVRLLVTFGSVAARYGRAERSVDALTSAALAGQASRLASEWSRCRVLHVDWPPWEEPRTGTGCAAPGRQGPAGPFTVAPKGRSSPEGAQHTPAAAPGIVPMTVADGSGLLHDVLATPEFPSRVAIHGRVGVPAPLTAAADPAAPTAQGRFLETVRVLYPGVELVVDTVLSLATDPYLADHRIDGLAALPVPIALEAMAQAASALAGEPLRRLADLWMPSPVVFPPGPAEAGSVIRVCALRQADRVETVLRCSETNFRVDHARTVFLPTRTGGQGEAPIVSTPAGDSGSPARAPRDEGEVRPDSESEAWPRGIVDGTDLYGPLCFQNGRFRRVAFLPVLSSRSCRALVRGSDDQPWFGAAPSPADAPLILGSPGLNDAIWHVLQACLPHRRMLPAGCESVTLTGRTVCGAVHVHADRRPAPGRDRAGRGDDASMGSGPPESAGHTSLVARTRSAPALWDVTALDAAGHPVAVWAGLRLREMGPIAHTAPWHPALLAVSLEARAAELGIDSSMRVVISSGPPRAAARPDAGHPPPHGSPALGRPASATPGTWEDTAVGRGPLDGFALHVQAGRPVACWWEAVRPLRTDGGRPGPRLRQRREARDQEATPSAEACVHAITACLAGLGHDPAAGSALEDNFDGGWVVVRAADAAVACAVVEISGVPAPVAVALASRPASAGEGWQAAVDRQPHAR